MTWPCKPIHPVHRYRSSSTLCISIGNSSSGSSSQNALGWGIHPSPPSVINSSLHQVPTGKPVSTIHRFFGYTGLTTIFSYSLGIRFLSFEILRQCLLCYDFLPSHGPFSFKQRFPSFRTREYCSYRYTEVFPRASRCVQS